MNRKGLTLIEVMIVVAIIGILSAVIFPHCALLIKNHHRRQFGLSSLTMEQMYPSQPNADTSPSTVTDLKFCPYCGHKLP